MVSRRLLTCGTCRPKALKLLKITFEGKPKYLEYTKIIHALEENR